MKMRNLYLGFFVIGTLVPYYFLIKFVSEKGWDTHEFIRQLFSNNISSFFGWDVIIAGIVLLLFIISDISRETIKYLWMAIAATIFIGVSAGLPLFLYLRERYLEESETQS